MISGSWPSGAKSAVLTVNGTAVTDELISITYTDDLTGGSAMTIGAAVAARVRFIVESPSVSYEAAAVTISIGGVPLGVFYVTDHSEKDGRLTVDAVDAMGTEVMQGEYVPAASSGTALGVVREICAAAGLTMGDASGLSDTPVSGLAEGHTYREMLGSMAAVLGRNAHIDRYGRLVFRWYETPSFGNAQAVDTGNGNIDLRGVKAEETDAGRVRITYGVSAVESSEGKIVLTANGVYLITVDDVYAGDLSKKTANSVLTGVACTVTTTTIGTETDDAGNTTTTEEQSTTTLTAGGAASISLRCDYMTPAALSGLYSRLQGFTYRPMTLSFYGDCRLETGDLIRVEDREGNAYNVPVATVTHSWDGGVKTTVTASGPTASYSGAVGAALSRVTQDLSAFKNREAANVDSINRKISQERTTREQAIQNLTKALVSASGLYQTTEAASGGGTIYYLHDKSTLAASSLVVKLTAEALGISTDGGHSWSAGFDFATQTAITNILQAAGVNADWINTGRLIISDSSGNVVFDADVDTGTVTIAGFTVTDTELSTALLNISNNVITIYKNAAKTEYCDITNGMVSWYDLSSPIPLRGYVGTVSDRSDLSSDGFFHINCAMDAYKMIFGYYWGGVNPILPMLTLDAVNETAEIGNSSTGFALSVNGKHVPVMSLLWTNSDPTVSFGCQTIAVSDILAYDMIGVEIQWSNTHNARKMCFATCEDGRILRADMVTYYSGVAAVYRDVTVGADQISFGYGNYSYDSGLTTSGNYAIPTKVYGIKL